MVLWLQASCYWKIFLFTHLDKDPKGTGMVAWFPENATWDTNWLGVYYNPNPTTTLLVYNSNMTYTAYGVGMHPHSSVATPSVVRFTAPNDGSYALSLTFTHVDDHARNTRTGLYIIHDNLNTLWEGEIFGQDLTGSVHDNINFASTLVTIDINLLQQNSPSPSSQSNQSNDKIAIIALGTSLVFAQLLLWERH
ncbi:pep-cterm domain protein [Gigaspora margarita]|uniref:Pep-cterm domain protein n=1 Tax=Gigaspora margarita TaxID=4874 RepID=A0A8H3WZH5_GIGMA|nr:pep-cterm domain protein [Gigaspora margarita]